MIMVSVAADQQRTHAEPDAVPLVGRARRFPERLRHDAEHRAAIEAEAAVAQRDQLEVAEDHERIARESDSGLDCFSSTSTPCALDG